MKFHGLNVNGFPNFFQFHAIWEPEHVSLNNFFKKKFVWFRLSVPLISIMYKYLNEKINIK